MIRFKKVDKLVSFLDENLPEKIKSELFYQTYYWEHKGKMCEGKMKEPNPSIAHKLIELEFLMGISDDPKFLLFPNEYILQWTKLKKFIEKHETISVDIEKYGLISINTACKMLDVTRPTIYKILNEKKVPFVEILSQKRIQLKDLLDYIEENKHT